MAAIHGLHLELSNELHDQTRVDATLRWHNAQLHSRNDALEARLARLEKAILREVERAPAPSTD